MLPKLPPKLLISGAGVVAVIADLNDMSSFAAAPPRIVSDCRITLDLMKLKVQPQ
jgi:hypothetical protein